MKIKTKVSLLISAVCASVLCVSACSGASDNVVQEIDDIINTQVPEIKTVEYSAVYIDSNTGLTSYATGTLELTEPLEYSFIADKVIGLSGFDIEIREISRDGDTVTIDFDSGFFDSDKNTEKNERSVLISMWKSMTDNFSEIENVCFGIDGGDFTSGYHTFSRETPFDAALLDTSAQGEKEHSLIEVDYSITYYDVIDDTMKEYRGTESFEGEIDPVFFVAKLSELIGTRIEVTDIVIDETRMTIDFSSEASPLGGTGAYEESKILDSIAEVMFEVFEEVNEICITADGNDYDSGHISLTKDTPYATRKEASLG